MDNNMIALLTMGIIAGILLTSTIVLYHFHKKHPDKYENPFTHSGRRK